MGVQGPWQSQLCILILLQTNDLSGIGKVPLWALTLSSLGDSWESSKTFPKGHTHKKWVRSRQREGKIKGLAFYLLLGDDACACPVLPSVSLSSPEPRRCVISGSRLNELR